MADRPPLATADAPHETIGKAGGPGRLCLRRAVLDGLRHPGNPGYPGCGRHRRLRLCLSHLDCHCRLAAYRHVSYEQTIHAYPGGGGAYIVARDNLGELPAQTAGAALLTDYILTVAVSVSSGVAQIVSAFPGSMTYRVLISVGLVCLVMLINLRGCQGVGRRLCPPHLLLHRDDVSDGRAWPVALLCRRPGHGGRTRRPWRCTASAGDDACSCPACLLERHCGLTGVEAISNGITAFREPRSRNAGITLIWMSAILGSLLPGHQFPGRPDRRGAVGSRRQSSRSSPARSTAARASSTWLIIAATTLILILAANTSFAGFPRLSAILAADGFLPRQLAYRGSRLVYSRGIMALASIASF